MTTVRLETRIAAPQEDCYDLSLTVEVHLTTPGSRERVVGGVEHGRMGLGDTVTWESRRFGFPVRMASKIVDVDEPRQFVDEMVSGPFRRWRHVHRFAPDGEGTLMTDTIDFASPLGPLGWVADRAFVRRYMTRLVEKQNRHICELAEGRRKGR